jgi:hypothetical protein
MYLNYRLALGTGQRGHYRHVDSGIPNLEDLKRGESVLWMSASSIAGLNNVKCPILRNYLWESCLACRLLLDTAFDDLLIARKMTFE